MHPGPGHTRLGAQVFPGLGRVPVYPGHECARVGPGYTPGTQVYLGLGVFPHRGWNGSRGFNRPGNFRHSLNAGSESGARQSSLTVSKLQIVVETRRDQPRIGRNRIAPVCFRASRVLLVWFCLVLEPIGVCCSISLPDSEQVSRAALAQRRGARAPFEDVAHRPRNRSCRRMRN